MQIKKTLCNNIMLIQEPVALSHVAAIGFWFSTGSRFEKKGQRGISHFCEHMLFKGTSSRTTHDISVTFDRIGGYVNAFTEKEAVCVYCTVPSIRDNVEKALDVLCDMSENSIFSPSELEKERAVIKNEISASEDDYEECAMDCASSVVWNDECLSQSISGSSQDVESLVREEIIDWYKKYFVHGELLVTIAGSYDGELVEKKLSSLSLRKPLLLYPYQLHFKNPVQWKSGTSLVKSPFSQSQVFCLYPYRKKISERKYYVMAVMNAIAGDTMSSRLFEALRERSGFCYNVYSYWTFYEGCSSWIAYASTEKQNAQSIVFLMEEEIEKLRIGNISQEELEGAKEHLCGEETIGGEDAEYLMKRLQRNFSMGFESKSTEEIVDEIRSVSVEEIKELLEELLVKDERALLVYGPKLKIKDKRRIVCR